MLAPATLSDHGPCGIDAIPRRSWNCDQATFAALCTTPVSGWVNNRPTGGNQFTQYSLDFLAPVARPFAHQMPFRFRSACNRNGAHHTDRFLRAGKCRSLMDDTVRKNAASTSTGSTKCGDGPRVVSLMWAVWYAIGGGSERGSS